MAPSIEDERLSSEQADGRVEAPSTEGPDPVIGAGITLLGIFLMGTGGAADAHWVFDFGALTGVLGAGIFVLFVALSVMRQRRALKDAGDASARQASAK